MPASPSSVDVPGLECLDLLPVAVLIAAHGEDNLRFVNRAALELFGADHPDDIPIVDRAALCRVDQSQVVPILGGRDSLWRSWTAVHTDGHSFEVMVSSRSVEVAGSHSLQSTIVPRALMAIEAAFDAAIESRIEDLGHQVDLCWEAIGLVAGRL